MRGGNTDVAKFKPNVQNLIERRKKKESPYIV